MIFEPRDLAPAWERQRDEYFALFRSWPEVLGVDIGYEYERNEYTGRTAIRFLVSRKVPAADLERSGKMSINKAVAQLPVQSVQLPIDILEIPFRGRPTADPDQPRRSRQSTLRPGLSISCAATGAGTMGAIVFTAEGETALLSCAHVLAPGEGFVGNPVFQPSPVDGGVVSFDMVARLAKQWRERDAALAVLTGARMVRTAQLGTDVVLHEAREIKTLGKVVTKSGRGTGVTEGRVDGIGVYKINLTGSGAEWIPGFLVLPIEGHRSWTELSGQGDSGAVWYAADRAGSGVAYGLHLAGERTEAELEYAVATHLPDVLEYFNVSLVPPRPNGHGGPPYRPGQGAPARAPAPPRLPPTPPPRALDTRPAAVPWLVAAPKTRPSSAANAAASRTSPPSPPQRPSTTSATLRSATGTADRSRKELSMSKYVYNFSAGPSALPPSVLSQASWDVWNLYDPPVSILELHPREEKFEEILEKAKANIACLFELEPEQHVLILPGGASLQFAMVPMNLKQGDSADYIVRGEWSRRAFLEAQRAYQIAEKEPNGNKLCDKKPEPLRKNPTATDYLHFTSNETIEGSAFGEPPKPANKEPVVCDMTSDFLSRPINASKFDLIYASTHRNAGIAGATVLIIRQELLDISGKKTYLPHALSYYQHKEQGTKLTTPPVAAIHLLYLMTNWLIEQGGLKVMARRNAAKAASLYATIDHSHGFYECKVPAACRSQMNVVFQLKTPDLAKQFIYEAEQQSLWGLDSPTGKGEVRASLYNAVTEEAVAALVQFMDEFRCRCKGC